jgi:hypothetical protein
LHECRGDHAHFAHGRHERMRRLQMTPSNIRNPCGITCRDRLHDLLVLAERCLPDGWRGKFHAFRVEHGLRVTRPDGLERTHDLHKSLVSTFTDEESVKLISESHRAGAIADGVLLFLHEPRELRNDCRGPVRTLGTHRGTQRFELPKRATDIGERRRRRLQNKTQGVRDPLVRRHVDVGPTDFASSNGDQTFGLEDAKSLASGWRTHFVVLDQKIELGHHLHFAAQYLGTDAVGNDLGHTRKTHPGLVVVALCSERWLQRCVHPPIVRRSTRSDLRCTIQINRKPSTTCVGQKVSDFHVRRY